MNLDSSKHFIYLILKIGSALDALSSMQTFLQGRPKLFNSIEQAIEYR
jgi:hypothetical protein